MSQSRFWHNPLCWLCLLGIIANRGVGFTGNATANPIDPPRFPKNEPIKPVQSETLTLLQQGEELYAASRYADAAQIFAQAVQVTIQQNASFLHAIALSNLALTQQQLGQTDQAQRLIAQSLQRLETTQNHTEGAKQRLALAQTLDIQGQLQLAQGVAEAALQSWQRASALYLQLNDVAGILRSRMNQAQAEQTLGFYRRALATLTDVSDRLHNQPASLTKAITLRSLGNAMRVTGNLKQSQQVLQQSLALAQQLQSAPDISAAYLSLGNTLRDLGRSQRERQAQTTHLAATPLQCHPLDHPVALSSIEQAAQAAYRQAAAIAPPSTLPHLQAPLNELGLLGDTQPGAAVQALWQQIQPQWTHLPPGRSALMARIVAARTLACAKQADGLPAVSWREIAQWLATSVQEAKTLKDPRAESYGLGYLGSVYRLTHQEAAAQQLTEQALLLAQAANAREISYRWQWQLGQIHQTQGERQKAIAAYTAGVENLRSLRSDLAALNSDTQFSFRDEVEPVYRQLVDLLLQSDGNAPPPQDNLIQARNVLETLQVVELENFFRAACLDAKPISIDQVDTHTAVLYPILLGNRVKTILSLPQQPLRLYEASLDLHWETQVERLRQALTQRNSQEVLPLAQRFYNQLIRPAAADLKNSGVGTLAFVLDGPLRNLPMAVLQDGHQYLMEQYSLALTPGLQLLKAQPLAPERLKALFAGLTEARQGFPALNHVAQEFVNIQTSLPNQSLLNQRFTRTNLQVATTSTHFPILHFATHGQFSSQADETFILSWDERLDIDQLNALIRRTPSKTREIDLLVLSACETATGDRRAALGLAGVAVRAGARSTLATLWLVNDASSAVLIDTFYQELAKTRATKAEALRQAQLALLSNPKYRHPYYWSPYVLIGNWL